MKKYLIIIVIIIILIIIILLALRSSPVPPEVNTNEQAEVEPVTQLQPDEIVVGLFDPNEEISEYTKLLESRLKTIGFQTIVLSELVDPEAANQEKTTLLFRSDTEEALEVVTREIIKATLYRKGQNEAIEQDVVISAWNIEDINWGDLKDEAEKFLHPELANVSLVVLNAGAESGAAGDLATLLQEVGYEQAEADNAEEGEETTWSAIIYYQRNFKEVAKDLRKFLSDEGYAKVTYRIRLEQEANIVIILGPELKEEEK